MLLQRLEAFHLLKTQTRLDEAVHITELYFEEKSVTLGSYQEGSLAISTYYYRVISIYCNEANITVSVYNNGGSWGVRCIHVVSGVAVTGTKKFQVLYINQRH